MLNQCLTSWHLTDTSTQKRKLECWQLMCQFPTWWSLDCVQFWAWPTPYTRIYTQQRWTVTASFDSQHQLTGSQSSTYWLISAFQLTSLHGMAAPPHLSPYPNTLWNHEASISVSLPYHGASNIAECCTNLCHSTALNSTSSNCWASLAQTNIIDLSISTWPHWIQWHQIWWQYNWVTFWFVFALEHCTAMHIMCRCWSQQAQLSQRDQATL